MSKKKKEQPKPEQTIITEDRGLPYYYGDYYDKYGTRRNSACRGCPFDGQCTTCLED